MRNLGILIFGIGTIILLASVISSQILTEQVVEGVTGRDTSFNLWYLLGGLALLVVGGALAMMDRPK